MSEFNCKPGDQVAYSRAFLKSTAAYTGEIPFMRGTVVERPDILGGLAKYSEYTVVLWDGETEPKIVLKNNLAFPGCNIRFCDEEPRPQLENGRWI